MKNRRSVIAIFLMVALLCLGIGYAAVSDDLTIDGTLNLSTGEIEDQFATDVKFANASVTTSDATTADDVTAVIGDTTADVTDEDDKLTITVANTEFKEIGQTVVVTVDVVNGSTADANVTIAGYTDASGVFSVVAEQVGGAAAITAGDSAEFTVTITLLMIPDADVTNQAFELTLTATSANP